MLAPDQAHELIAAHLDGVLALGDQFVAWGPIGIRRPDPADVDAVLARGCVGISLPSAALADLDALEAIGPVLERVQELDAPLFVHPGGFAPRPAVAVGSALVDGADQLRVRHAGGVADVRDARPPRAAAAAGACSRCSRAARRCRPSD